MKCIIILHYYDTLTKWREWFHMPPQNATLLADCMIKATRINNLPLYNDINKSDEKVKFLIKVLAD